MRIGMDLGGTTIGAAAVTADGQLLFPASDLTRAQDGADAIVCVMAGLVRKIEALSGEKYTELGVGTPGAVDVTGRIVVVSPNLPFDNYPLADKLEAQTGCRVYLGNDANCALLGEQASGAAKGARDAVMITLGTGVGGGVSMNGKLLTGFNGAAGEIGHMTFVKDGLACGCGRKGCYEAYASTTALIRQADLAAGKNPQSLLAQYKKDGCLDGKHIFDAAHAGDETALSVLDAYEDNVAQGAASLINIFEPEILVFGGGISGQGEYLISALREKILRQIYCPVGLPRTKILAAQLGSDAGIVGAAALVLQ